MAKRRNWIKITLRIVTVLFAVIFITLSFFVYRFIKPKTDEIIFNKFKDEINKPFIKKLNYNDHVIRVISMQEILDTTLPVLIFVHGSPGMGMDFKRYLSDVELNENSNLITYDRIGYSVDVSEHALGDLDGELEILHQITPKKNFKNVILIGYSYGGTIVAASPKAYRSKILLAPATLGELEPMSWMLNLYKWKVTRSIVPNVFQNAAKEKIEHLSELPLYENKWTLSSSHITSIHGDKDRIVPYGNSLFLKSKFNNNQFELITIPNGNHGLVWNRFDLIKSEILKEIRK